jgi:tetratricopeptide (TPR) repeat protein
MSKKKKGPRGRPKGKGAHARLREQLGEVETLLRRGKWVEADERLEALDRQCGGPAEILALRLQVAVQLKDFATQLEVTERLVALLPDDPMLQLQLAAAYVNNHWSALALRAFHSFVERWPHHPEASRIRQTVEIMEPEYREYLAEIGLGGPDELQRAAQHEQVQVLLARGKFEKARQLAARLIEALPHFAPPYNNSAQASALEGDYAQAIELSRRVLAFDPDNIHTRSNLIRFLCQIGQFDEAKEEAKRLRELKPAHGEGWVKVVEAMAILGNDAGVLRAAEHARQSPPASPGSAALCEHLAAVAAYRQGRHDEAHRYWEQALRHQPNFEPARANLEDLRRPVTERHAPWPFSMAHWLPEKFITELMTLVQVGGPRLSNEEVRQRMAVFLERHPEAERVTPALFDRGDEGARTWALNLALMVRTPFLLEALRDFTLSDRGPDQQRVQASQVLSEAGMLDSPVRMWLQGQWRDVSMMGFEVSGDPVRNHPPQVAELTERGVEALNARDGVAAESILRQALALEPNAPDILNNLGLALIQQGRQDEADQLLHDLHARFPDYLFARVTLARRATLAGRLDEADALLEPLLKTRKLHFAEFAVLAMAEIELQLAHGRPEGADSWLDMWERTMPDHPKLPYWRRLVRGPGRSHRRR